MITSFFLPSRTDLGFNACARRKGTSPSPEEPIPWPWRLLGARLSPGGQLHSRLLSRLGAGWEVVAEGHPLPGYPFFPVPQREMRGSPLGPAVCYLHLVS